MKQFTTGQNHGQGRTCGRRHTIVPTDRQSAKSVNAKTGHHPGDAEVLVMTGLLELEESEEPSHGKKARDKNNRGVHFFGRYCEDAPEKTEDTKGPKTRRAAAGRLIALSPAAFQPDKQPDRQRNSQPEKLTFQSFNGPLSSSAGAELQRLDYQC